MMLRFDIWGQSNEYYVSTSDLPMNSSFVTINGNSSTLDGLNYQACTQSQIAKTLILL